MNTSRRLWIVEGPDGAGKSTLVAALAARTGACVFHHGPYRRVTEGLERLYAESVAPAVLGHADVILDRSWLSEVPYGLAFRNGADRLGPAARRQLERLALRCAAVVVRCLPPWGRVAASFAGRRAAEMLSGTEQLRAVYDWYHGRFATALPTIDYDYVMMSIGGMIDVLRDEWTRRDGSVVRVSTRPHPAAWRSAGNLDAPVALIGDAPGERTNRDGLLRWPSFGFGAGGNKSLALRLERAGVSERDLFWVDACDVTDDVAEHLRTKVAVALGGEARKRLCEMNVAPATDVPHPRDWGKFRAGAPDEDYPLIPFLQEVLRGEHDERRVADGAAEDAGRRPARVAAG
jgi:hypothetical protein